MAEGHPALSLHSVNCLLSASALLLVAFCNFVAQPAGAVKVRLCLSLVFAWLQLGGLNFTEVYDDPKQICKPDWADWFVKGQIETDIFDLQNSLTSVHREPSWIYKQTNCSAY